MVTKVTEKKHAGSCIMQTANGNMSFDNITLLSGQVLLANTVLGKITATGKYKVYDQQAGDGSEAAAGILLHDCDATSGDTRCAIIARDAAVIADELIWPAGSPTDVTAGIDDLKAIGILVRS